MEEMTDEIRNLQFRLGVTNFSTHYLTGDGVSLEAVLVESGVAFLNPNRSLGVNRTGSWLLRVQLSDDISVSEDAAGQDAVTVNAEVFKNSEGREQYLIVTAKINEVLLGGEVYSSAPLFMQPSHDLKMEEWWLEMTHALIGPSLKDSPVRVCWSLFCRELKNG